MKWFNNRKVGIKVLLACLIFMTVIGVLSMMGVLTSRNSSKTFDELFNDRFTRVGLFNRIHGDLLQIRINIMETQLRAEAGEWNEVQRRKQWTNRLTDE